MERIMYRKTLDVHKNGIQFLLQGFETADNLSRVIEISLMASGDAIDFPLENIEALMYVKTQSATEPSINSCIIRDNKVVYDVLPIVEEGITIMQLKIIETSVDGAKNILASPKFAVEVTKSDADDGNAEQTTTFTALEDAIATAKAVYDERFLRMELSSDCIFRAYYADGTVYETDVLKRLFLNGNVLLSESFAHGSTGVRAGEDTDNSMYYSNVSKSEAINATNMVEVGKEILEETKLHGMYTAFSVDFETGKVEYVSPSFKFKVNNETGELDAEGQTYTFDKEIQRVVDAWLLDNNVVAQAVKAIETQGENIRLLQNDYSSVMRSVNDIYEYTFPIKNGGTGATTAEEARANLGAVSQEDFDKKIISGKYSGMGAFTHSFQAEGGTTTLEIDMGQSFDRVTVYLDIAVPIILYLNRENDAVQKGLRLTGRISDVSEVKFASTDDFSLRLLYDSYHNNLENDAGTTWIKSPRIEGSKIIIPFQYAPSSSKLYDMKVNYYWENG